ncbi:transthyretin isoform X2 [Salmo salar]|uniref:Transthyretin n=1 Tax=Salmo salar TaxID=8030 RepID=A0A1S3KJI0_SALSA|nr:transthyretin isoform X1 [Salmo salar]XP_013978738.1 transthyretin isoform X2 [Salmo salar]|eukprot:XP_013978738.1 PREDICTED: transthyretin isoform X2 [Salmo salar]
MDSSLLCVLLAAAVLLCSAAPVDRHGESDTHCPLMVKILDAVKGVPAGAVTLSVSRRVNEMTWAQVASGVTDLTGEVHNLISDQDFQSGVYRVEFDTKAYWKSQGTTPFHETAEVVFEAHAEGHRHYTLALLLSPFSYTTTAVVMKAHE